MLLCLLFERPCWFKFTRRTLFFFFFLVGGQKSVVTSSWKPNAALVRALRVTSYFHDISYTTFSALIWFTFNRSAYWKYKRVLTNTPVVWGERRTRWGNPWGDLSSDSWHRARRVSRSELCSGCSSPQTSVSPSTGKPAAQTGERESSDIIGSDRRQRNPSQTAVRQVKLRIVGIST